MTEYHQALPQGWEVGEDSHGRIFFINKERNQTQWQDPRISDAALNKQEQKRAPTVVKAAFALFEIQESCGFNSIDEIELGRVLEKHEGTDAKAFIKKPDFLTLVKQTVKNDARASVKITDRIFSLIDLKYESEIEFRVALLALIFLSTLTTYRKIQYAFLVLDTTRKGRLNKENLFALFKAVTRIVENHHYRYKLAMSNRSLLADVLSCLRIVVVKKGRVDDGTITFPEFINYAIEDPLILRVVTMLDKIQVSRSSVHNGKKCEICTMFPIQGIRYKTLQNKVNMCENCFWKGQESQGFKRNEAVIEYPTRHRPQKVIMQKVSGRFLPTVKHSGRQPDNEASKQEFINEKGRGKQL